MKVKKLLAFIVALSPLVASAAIPKVVAHRGYWNVPGASQNSIAALQKADSIHADAVELDVWISSDDVLFVNHDPSYQGLVLEQTPAAQLSKCRLSNGEALPTLSDFLEAAKKTNVDLVVEIKSHADKKREDRAVSEVVKMVREKDLESRTSYITFSRNAFDGLVAMTERPVQYLDPMEPALLESLGGAGGDYHISVYRKNPHWIDELQDKGKTVNVWTVDKPEDLQWCIDRGVDFITTNEPELAMSLIEKANKPRPLKLMTYNLRFGELSKMDRLAEEIKAQNADFVALQELDDKTMRPLAKQNNGLSYITELAQKTGMFGFYGRTIDVDGGYYGIGILSKYPAIKVEKFDLPNPENVEPRILLKGLFEMDGKKIIFACTHLDYISAASRQLQAKRIVELLRGEKYPVILAGDMNVEPGEETLNILKSNFKDLTNTTPTYPADKPTDKLDYILVSPADMFEFKSCWVPEPVKKPASDHLPVVSEAVLSFK